MKQITDYSEIVEIEQKYKVKGTVTNNYIMKEQYKSLISDNALCFVANEKNCFLFVKKVVNTRIYYFINDMGEKADFSQCSELVIEILFRDELPVAEMEYFLKCGFKTNLVRDQYSGMYKDLQIGTFVGNLRIDEAQSIEEVKQACELFNASFDHFSGDYISENEYPSLLKGKNILIAKDIAGNSFLGALHHTIENRVAWISHVAVLPKARGHHVGLGLAETFVQRYYVDEKSRYMLWVQHQNTAAVNMYQKMGFKYIGKSTLSMIKLK